MTKKRCSICMLMFVLMLSVISCASSVAPYFNWQGKRSNDNFCILEEKGFEHVEEIGGVYLVDTDDLEPVGIVRLVLENHEISEVPFATNMEDAIQEGASVYEVTLNGQPWLMVEGCLGDKPCQWFFGGWRSVGER